MASETIGGQAFLKLSVATPTHVPFKGLSLELHTDAVLGGPANPYAFVGSGLYPFDGSSVKVFKQGYVAFGGWSMVLNESPSGYVGFMVAVSSSRRTRCSSY